MSVAPRVGRRKEPILGYDPKNDEKNNLVYKGLRFSLTQHLTNIDSDLYKLQY